MKQWGLKVSVLALDAIIWVVKLIKTPIIFICKRPAQVLGKFFLFLLTRVYKILRPYKKQLSELFFSHHSSLRTVFTNKYVIHVIVIVIAILISGQNLLAYDTVRSENFGQNSLLYAMIGHDQFEEIVEEKALDDKSLQPDLSPSKYAPQNAVSSFPVVQESSLIAQGPNMLETSGAVVKPDLIKTETIQKRDTVINYTIQSGDTISTIAQKFGVSTNTIYWENDLSSYSTIRPGDSIRILPVTGIAHKVASGETLQYIANKYDSELEEIVDFNKLANASDLDIGQQLIIPEGKKTATYTRSTPTVASSKPTTATSTPTTLAASPSANVRGMIWPTDTKRITQYYHWRHQGIDIGGAGVSRPLYAVDSGTVTYVGWRNGYGNTVEIKLDNGYVARYAHLSKFHTSKGVRVGKGDVVGIMGTTGWSTGIHLHFELMKNGTKYNPLNLIN